MSENAVDLRIAYPDVFPTVQAAARFLGLLAKVWQEPIWRGLESSSFWQGKARDEAFRRYLKGEK